MVINWLVCGSTILMLLPVVRGRWLNEYRGDLEFECLPGEHLSRITSEHSFWENDRVWTFDCTMGFISEKCTWTPYQNEFDGDMNFQCEENGLITGVSSYYDNNYEDRKWKYKCCALNTKPGKNCATTDWVNDWRDDINEEMEKNTAIRGFESYHKDRKEDRKWKIHYCEMRICVAKRLELTETVSVKDRGRKVVGIATSQGCHPSVEYTTSLQHQYEQSETISVSDTIEHAMTFGYSISFGIGFDLGVTVDLTAEYSFEYGLTLSTTETEEKGKSFTAGSSQDVEYQGPGAALILAEVHEYEIAADAIGAEYTIECDDGDIYKEKTNVSLSRISYGQTHYMIKVGKFAAKADCTEETEKCFDDLKGKNALQPDKVVNEFKACLTGKADIA